MGCPAPNPPSHHSQTLFCFFSFEYNPFPSLPTQHSRALPTTFHSAVLQNKRSPPFVLLCSFSSSSSYCFLNIFPLFALTSVFSSPVAIPSHSSCAQRGATRSSTSSHCSTRVRSILSVMCKVNV